MKNREEQLIAHYQKALSIKPDSSAIYQKLGKLYVYKGEFDRAFHYYLKAVNFNPGCYQFYGHLNQALRAADLFNQSINSEEAELGIKILSQLIHSQKRLKFTRLLLGNLLSREGRIEEAIACYQTVSYQQTLASHPEIAKQHWHPQQLRQPDFIICGLPKCGTTSLYHYLTAHPQILTAVEKEICFFSHYFERGLDWYLAHFPAIQDNNYLTGEATPLYLAFVHPKKIFQLLPKVKLIVLLRNPVDRTISSFYQFQRVGVKQKDLEHSIRLSMEKIREIPIPKKNYAGVFSNCSFIDEVSLFHTIPSLYIYFIKEWMKVFPKEQFLILKSEDFYSNPLATMKQVHRFLNLPDYQLTEYRNYNPGSYPLISLELRQQLEEFFHPYNQQLEEYLGRKFNWE